MYGCAASMLKDLAFGNLRNPGQSSSVGRPRSLKICHGDMVSVKKAGGSLAVKRTLLTWSISPRPGSKGSRRISSPKMHPIDHMSTAVVYSVAPKRSSGALQAS